MNAIKITSVWLMVTMTLQAQPGETVPVKPLQRQIGLGIGFQQRQLLDEQKSALVYASAEYNGGLFFRNANDRSVFSLDLNFSTGNYFAKHFRNRQLYTVGYNMDGTITTDSLPVFSGILSGVFEVSYLKRIASQASINWYIGPAIKDMLVYPENNIGLLNSLGIYLAVQASGNIDAKNRLSARIAIPLAAINSRLPWHNTATSPLRSETRTFFSKGTRLVTTNNFQSVQFNLNYTFRIASRWDLGADYAFIWLRIPYYQPMKSILNNFQLQTAYRF